MNEVKVYLIAAMDRNRNIGFNGEMPWGMSMRSDLERFKRITTGKAVLMGRKTYESIGGPLDNRLNLVLTRDVNYSPEELIIDIDGNKESTVVNSIQAAVNVASILGHNEIYVIGGAELYEQTIEYADRLYITKVHANLRGDTKFPSIVGKWKVDKQFTYPADENNPFPYTFVTYERG